MVGIDRGMGVDGVDFLWDALVVGYSRAVVVLLAAAGNATGGRG